LRRGLTTLVSAFALLGCGKAARETVPAPVDELDAALAPAAAVAALRGAGGGHLHATTALKIAPRGNPDAQGGSDESVTTTTDLWLDRGGQYRLVETNDRDGGREVVLHGKELGVALRYAKMVRRPAQEPEPTRILEEALGGPWAGWEIARRFAGVERREEHRAGGDVLVYRLTRSVGPQAVRATAEDPLPLRKWRETVSVESLAGEVRLAAASHAVLAATLEARFSLTRDGAPLDGAVKVEARLDDVGQVPAIAAPVADELRPRQRTILEERALLGRAVGAPGEAPSTPRGKDERERPAPKTKR
jgi:hypothetical protein